MKLMSSKQVAVMAVVALSTIGASLSPAAAIDQHRVYPGSDSAKVKQARDASLAPNLYCEKHENQCQ